MSNRGGTRDEHVRHPLPAAPQTFISGWLTATTERGWRETSPRRRIAGGTTRSAGSSTMDCVSLIPLTRLSSSSSSSPLSPLPPCDERCSDVSSCWMPSATPVLTSCSTCSSVSEDEWLCGEKEDEVEEEGDSEGAVDAACAPSLQRSKADCKRVMRRGMRASRRRSSSPSLGGAPSALISRILRRRRLWPPGCLGLCPGAHPLRPREAEGRRALSPLTGGRLGGREEEEEEG